MLKALLSVVSISLVLLGYATSRADTFGTGANSFEIEFVPIRNPGNPADTTGSPNPAGSVAYTFRMGKYEISEQMIDKANALGNLGITKDTRGPDKPATSLTWYEAATFVNWLNTSEGYQPAYDIAAFSPALTTIEGGSSVPEPVIENRARLHGARYFLPSNDEWYKAAYYDPTAGVYYDYPTGSNSVPDGLDFSGDPNFDAVFHDAGINQPHDITDVGFLSPYGTAGQGGNVSEWLDSGFWWYYPPSENRTYWTFMYRGGIWATVAVELKATIYDWWHPSVEEEVRGFRVVSLIVPEPASLCLLGLIAFTRSTRTARRQR